MSKLRDEIAELVYVYANRRESGFAYPTDQMVANEILDKVREALLSEWAVKASVRAQFDDGDELDDESFTESSTPGQPGYGWVGHLKGIWVDQITAALDAVTGEGDR